MRDDYTSQVNSIVACAHRHNLILVQQRDPYWAMITLYHALRNQYGDNSQVLFWDNQHGLYSMERYTTTPLDVIPEHIALEQMLNHIRKSSSHFIIAPGFDDFYAKHHSWLLQEIIGAIPLACARNYGSILGLVAPEFRPPSEILGPVAVYPYPYPTFSRIVDVFRSFLQDLQSGIRSGAYKVGHETHQQNWAAHVMNISGLDAIKLSDEVATIAAGMNETAFMYAFRHACDIAAQQDSTWCVDLPTIYQHKKRFVSQNPCLSFYHPRYEGSGIPIPGFSAIKEYFTRLFAILPDVHVAGVLFVGPPGSGKFAAVEAIAAHLSVPCLTLNVPRLLQYDTAQAQAMLSHALHIATFSCPQSLFVIKDVDALVAARADSAVSALAQRVMNWLDEANTPSPVTIITASDITQLPASISASHKIDAAFSFYHLSEQTQTELLYRSNARWGLLVDPPPPLQHATAHEIEKTQKMARLLLTPPHEVASHILRYTEMLPPESLQRIQQMLKSAFHADSDPMLCSPQALSSASF